MIALWPHWFRPWWLLLLPALGWLPPAAYAWTLWPAVGLLPPEAAWSASLRPSG